MAQANLTGGVNATRNHFLCFGSHARTSGSNTDFTIDFNNVQWGQDRMFEISLKQANIPNEFYNVWEGANTIHMTVPSVNDLVITPGFYTEADLIQAVEDAVDSVIGAGNTTITIEPLTGKWIMTTTVNVALDYIQSDSISRTIGLYDHPNAVPSASTSLTFPAHPNLNRPGHVCIYMSTIEHQTVEDKSSITELMDVISLANTEKHAMASFSVDSKDLRTYKWPEVRHLNTVRIYLKDEYGLTLSLPPNFDIQLYFMMGLHKV